MLFLCFRAHDSQRIFRPPFSCACFRDMGASFFCSYHERLAIVFSRIDQRRCNSSSFSILSCALMRTYFFLNSVLSLTYLASV